MARCVKTGILIFLCMTAGTCMKTLSIDSEREKASVLSLLKELDSFYKEDGFIVQRVLFPNEEWTATWLGVKSPDRVFDPTDANIRSLMKKKANDPEFRRLCTDSYLSRIDERISKDRTVNFGIALTDHEWGDNLSGTMADPTYLDYLPRFDAEGYNPILAENEKLTPGQIDAWHKARIVFGDDTTAAYTLLYTEVGLAARERELAFFVIKLAKTPNGWKIDDIAIKEDTKQNILSFYEKSMESRKSIR